MLVDQGDAVLTDRVLLGLHSDYVAEFLAVVLQLCEIRDNGGSVGFSWWKKSGSFGRFGKVLKNLGLERFRKFFGSKSGEHIWLEKSEMKLLEMVSLETTKVKSRVKRLWAAKNAKELKSRCTKATLVLSSRLSTIGRLAKGR